MNLQKKSLIIEEHLNRRFILVVAGILVKKKFRIELENLCLDKKYIFEIFDKEKLLENNGINSTLLDKWIIENE